MSEESLELRERIAELEAKLRQRDEVLTKFARATGATPDAESFLRGLARLVLVAAAAQVVVAKARRHGDEDDTDEIVPSHALNVLRRAFDKAAGQ